MAGGKGELSFELINLSAIPSTVCDPRPLQLKMYLRRLRLGVYHRNKINAGYNSSGITPVSPFEVPPHLRIMFETWPNPTYPHNWLPVDKGGDTRGGKVDTGGGGEGTSRDTEQVFPSALLSETNFICAQNLAQSLTWDRSGLHEAEFAQDGILTHSQRNPSRAFTY